MATQVSSAQSDSLDTLTEQLSPKGSGAYLSVSHGDFKFHANARPALIQRPKRKTVNVPEQRKFQTEAASSFAKFPISPPRASFKPKPRAQKARPFEAVSLHSDTFKWVYVKPPSPFKPVNSKKLINSNKGYWETTHSTYAAHGVQPRAKNYKPKARFQGSGKPFSGVSESMSAFQAFKDAVPRKPFRPERKTVSRVDDRDWTTSTRSTQAAAVAKSPKAGANKKDIAANARAAANSRPELGASN